MSANSTTSAGVFIMISAWPEACAQKSQGDYTTCSTFSSFEILFNFEVTAGGKFAGQTFTAKGQACQLAVDAFNNDLAVRHFGLEQRQCFEKARIFFRLVVERQDVDVDKQVVVAKGVLDLLEQGSDAVMAGADRDAYGPMVEQEFDCLIEPGVLIEMWGEAKDA